MNIGNNISIAFKDSVNTRIWDIIRDNNKENISSVVRDFISNEVWGFVGRSVIITASNIKISLNIYTRKLSHRIRL